MKRFHTRIKRRSHWLILVTVGLAFVVGLVSYGQRPAVPPTPEQLCREQLGLSRQPANSGAGATLLGACINDVTHSRHNPPSTPSR